LFVKIWRGRRRPFWGLGRVLEAESRKEEQSALRLFFMDGPAETFRGRETNEAGQA
jgi:hypothetical protein